MNKDCVKLDYKIDSRIAISNNGSLIFGKVTKISKKGQKIIYIIQCELEASREIKLIKKI